jgi:hypothetical protein
MYWYLGLYIKQREEDIIRLLENHVLYLSQMMALENSF